MIAGDICPLEDHSINFQESWLDTKFRYWIKDIDAKNKIFIFGNHDLIGEYPVRMNRLFGYNTEYPATYLQDTYVDFDGVKFYGSPWIPPIWGAFQADEKFLKEKYSSIPDDTQVVISHSPPFGIGDLAPRLIPPEREEEWPVGEHCGSHALKDRLLELNNPLTVWGHIHCSYGIYKIGENVGANVALLDNSYSSRHKPVCFVLENKKVVSTYLVD